MIEAIKEFFLGIGLAYGLGGVALMVAILLLISITFVGLFGLTLIIILKLFSKNPSDSSR